jgi:hypothetical protein
MVNCGKNLESNGDFRTVIVYFATSLVFTETLEASS